MGQCSAGPLPIMQRISELSLSNVVYFSGVTARMDIPGVTWVRGLNLDSDPASPTGNGSGKSLFFSALPNVFYFSPPTAKRKRAKRDILGKRGAKIGIKFKSIDGNDYCIEQSSSSYKIYKNGSDLEVATASKAEKMIRELFPMSETVYYTTCYISTLRSYPFQTDTDLQRMEHLVSMFELDQYERLKAHFASKLATIKTMEVKLSVLKQRKLSLTESLSKFDQNSLGTDDHLTKIKDLCRKKESKLRAVSSDVHSQRVCLRDLKSLLEIENELQEMRRQYSYKSKPQSVLKELEESLYCISEWAAYSSGMTRYEESRRKLESQLKELSPPTDTYAALSKRVTSLTASLDELRDDYSSLIKEQSKHRVLVEAVDSAVAKLGELGVSDVDGHRVDSYDYTDDIAQCRTTIKLEHLIECGDSHDGKCPTCLSDIDKKSIASSVESARKRLKQLLRKEKLKQYHDSYLKALEAVRKSKYKGDAELNALKSRIDKRTVQLKQLQSARDEAREYERVQAHLADLDKPAKPKSPKPKQSRKDIEADIELCNSILRLLSAKSRLLSNSESVSNEVGDYKSPAVLEKAIQAVSDSIKSLEEEESSLSSSIASLRTKIENIATARSEYELYRSELADVRSQISKMLPSVQQRNVLEVLIKAYGSKGLRTIAAAKICSLLESNMNRYRGLIFAEPFEFSVTASDKGMSILVDRGNGHVSDVRNLSGAESNCYRMLFVLSVLPLVPSHLRVNILVLDEPMSHADDATRTIFRERFIPAISEVVESIYILSPNTDDYTEGSAEWLVKKENGVSVVLGTGIEVSKPKTNNVNKKRRVSSQ